MSRENKKVTWR